MPTEYPPGKAANPQPLGSDDINVFSEPKNAKVWLLASEPGTSLRAAGWRQIGEVSGRLWSTPSRPRVDRHPLQAKLYFEASP